MVRTFHFIVLAIISVGIGLFWLEVTPPIARTEHRGALFIWLPAVYFFHGLLYLIPALRRRIPLFVPILFGVAAAVVSLPPLPWIAFMLLQLYFIWASYGHKSQQNTI